MTQTDNCRMAVYDKEGNLLGYKADTLWTICKNPEHAKIHPSRDCWLEGHLIENLVHLSNNPDEGISKMLGLKKIPGDGYNIDVEKIGADGTLKEIIARYQLTKDTTGRYTAVPRND